MAGKDAEDDPYSIFVFLDQTLAALGEAEALAAAREDERLSAESREAMQECFAAVSEEVQQARKIFADEPGQAERARTPLRIANSNRVVAAQRATIAQSEVDAETREAVGQVLDYVKIGLEKLIEYLSNDLLKAILKDVAILIPQLKEWLLGKDDKIGDLVEDVAELEAKIERFLHQVLGNPLVKDETRKGAQKIPKVDGPPEEPTLEGSLLWYLWDIERKLEHLWKRVTGQSFPRATPGSIVTDPDFDQTERGIPIGQEIDELTKIVECLAKLLGKTLYNAEWDCLATAPTPQPPAPGDLHPVGPNGHRGARVVPPRSIKDELHDIEAMLRIIIDILRNPPEPPEWPDPVIVPVPDGTEILPIPPQLKRIFVYEQGTFRPRSDSEEKAIDVRTAAFDLSGWIDLTDMADGDAVLVQMFVHLPGQVRRLYRERRFTGSAEAGLKHLSDVVGPGYIVGNHIEVIIHQPESASGYADILNIAFQFVVESQQRAA